MTAIRAWFHERLTQAKESKSILFLLLVLFALVPFQRRFHGALDSFSRRLALPDFPLPECFSTKVHLFISDLVILALTLLILLVYKVRYREFFWRGPSKYLTLLFFVALASIYFSMTSSYSLQYFRLFQFSMIFLFFNSICCSQYKIDVRSSIKKIAWIILFVSCLECAVGIYQYFYQQPIGLRFLGEPNLYHFPFANPGKHRWFLDKLLNPSQSSVFLYRATGTFPHPNILGGYLFCSLMASYYLWVKEERKLLRLFVLGAILLQIFTLYTAYSRSAMLALALSTLIWCAFQLRESFRQHGFRLLALRKFAILGATILVGCAIGIGLFFSQISARGGILNYNSVTEYADTERVKYLKIAVEMIKDHPLLGIGFNNFQLAAQPFQAEFPGHIFFSKVHNIYLLMASETGLIGGGLFLLFLGAILKVALRAVFSRPNDLSKDAAPQEEIFLFATFLGLLLIGICDFYFLNTQHGRIIFFGFSALLYAVTATYMREKKLKF